VVPTPASVEIEPIASASPDSIFDARSPVAERLRPLPTVRRGIFFDVENSSRPEHVAAVLDHLQIDRSTRRTDLFAVGNWKMAGVETARLLARHGAQLIHSAPAAGVKDWSDLRIAVAAGVWLASARPGDTIEVITDDQAFHAVGDVAAGLGVEFHQLSFRGLASRGVLPAGVEPGEGARRGQRGRRRGPRAGGERHRGEGRPPGARAAPRPGAPDHTPAQHAPAHRVTQTLDGAGHTAPAEEIRAAVEGLLQMSPAGVTLDTLSNTLKSRGFRRPPGSPRLITRLRHLTRIEVTPSGIVRLRESPASQGAATEDDEMRAPHPMAQAPGMPAIVVVSQGAEDETRGNEALPAASAPGSPGSGNQRRRGGRRRGRRS